MLDERINLRFMVNNFAKSDAYQSAAFSSEETTYPFSNIEKNHRSKVWKASGRFQITSSNKELYIHDGSNKTVTLTEGEYTTAASLATHIQTQLNASSSDWTVSYSSSTYKFTIANLSSVTLRFSETTNAVWETLGLLDDTDSTTLSFTSDEMRCHYPCEYIKYDFGYFVDLGFVGLIGSPFSEFKVSKTATITLEANTIDDWSSPPLSVTIPRTPQGAFKFIDTETASYRYVRILIQDLYNPYGPNGVELGHVYIGDFQSLDLRNINRGFSFEEIDPTEPSFSESGVTYSDVKTKRTNFSDLSYGFVQPEDMTTLREIFSRVGKTTPFYISIDPQVEVSDSISDLTRFVYFDSNLRFTHVVADYYNANFSLREAI